MPLLQVLESALDRRFVTPARLSAIVAAGSGYKNADALIGPAAETADAATALANQKRWIDAAREKIESLLAGRFLYRQKYRSRQPGSGMRELQLPQWPAENEALEIESVDLDDYRLNGDRYLYRDGGWKAVSQLSALGGLALAGTERDSYRVDFWAGYLMPGQIHKWVASRAYIASSSESVDEDAAGLATATWGSWTYPSDPTNRLRFECTTAGTTSVSEPSWPEADPWEPTTAYVAAAPPAPPSWVLATDGPIGLWFECTSAGTSGAADEEPAWPVTAGETVTDGTAEWTARESLTFAEGPDTLEWTAHFTEVLPITLQELAGALAVKMALKSMGQACEGDDEDKCCMKFVEALRFAA